jgi:capsular exopolysaccharide synthesis family protein
LNNIFEEQLDLKKEIFIYLSYWRYFVICCVIALSTAFFYLRYTNPLYSIEAKIKILEESNKGLRLPSELLGIMASKTGINLENEVETIKSRRLLDPVVTQLNLTTSYYSNGKFREIEFWDAPVKVTAIVGKDFSFSPISFYIKIKQDGYIIGQEGGKEIILSGTHCKTKINNVELIIEPNNNYRERLDKKVIGVKIISFGSALESLKKTITVDKVGDVSEILSIKIQDVNTERGIAIVNKIVDVFNQDGISDRRLINKKTVDFIDDRFQNLKFELDSIEGNKRDFKMSQDISFIEADAAIDINKKAGADESLFRVETQIQLSQLLKDALNISTSSILPANIGLDNVIINTLINEYNALVLQRERLLKTAGSENPVLKGMDSQISVIKNNINESIYIYSRQLKVSLAQQQFDYSKSSASVLKIPANEKTLRNIERQQKIKENLYLLLLQKREESAISYAVTAPSVKIIEYAGASAGPIAPKRNIIFLVALVLGLGIPLGVIFIYNLLDTKVKDTNEVAFRKSQIPVIAEIPFFKDFRIFKDKNDRSVHAESFRILSSNTDFSLPIKESGVGHVILITSSIMGEGKTFIATNLSLAYASYNKKVLLIGADMRKPKLHLSFEITKVDKGLSTYLHDSNSNWRDVVVKNNPYNENLDIIFSGIIPPNPSNIISNGRFDSLINAAKLEYDYVIIDTTPTIYVNDTFLIANNADLTLYITRQDYTEKKLIDYAAAMQDSAKLKNVVFVFNGIKEKIGYGSSYKYSYNYGYGYGYDEEDKISSKAHFLINPYRFVVSYLSKKNNL